MPPTCGTPFLPATVLVPKPTLVQLPCPKGAEGGAGGDRTWPCCPHGSGQGTGWPRASPPLPPASPPTPRSRVWGPGRGGGRLGGSGVGVPLAAGGGGPTLRLRGAWRGSGIGLEPPGPRCDLAGPAAVTRDEPSPCQLREGRVVGGFPRWQGLGSGPPILPQGRKENPRGGGLSPRNPRDVTAAARGIIPPRCPCVGSPLPTPRRAPHPWLWTGSASPGVPGATPASQRGHTSPFPMRQLSFLIPSKKKPLLFWAG